MNSLLSWGLVVFLVDANTLELISAADQVGAAMDAKPGGVSAVAFELAPRALHANVALILCQHLLTVYHAQQDGVTLGSRCVDPGFPFCVPYASNSLGCPHASGSIPAEPPSTQINVDLSK